MAIKSGDLSYLIPWDEARSTQTFTNNRIAQYIFHKAANFLIFTLVLLNICMIYFQLKHSILCPVSFKQIPHPIKLPSPDIGGFPHTTENITFDNNELETAIKKLNIPTWSKGYVHCSNPRSEIKCWQVIKAYRKILEWESAVQKLPKDDSTPFIVHTYTKNGGIGNRLMQECVATAVAMMLGRAVSVEARVPAGYKKKVPKHPYDYPVAGTVRYTTSGIKACSKNYPNIELSVLGNYTSFDFFNESLNKYHLYFRETSLSDIIYLNQQVSDFVREFFGMFAQYFIINYISTISQRYFDLVSQIFDPVPPNTRLFGVHLRFQWAGQFYSWSINSTMNVVVPFINSILSEQPTVLCLASDNEKLMTEFGKYFPYLQTNATHKPDFDHDSGFSDIVMLMYCHQFLLTYRSTFSSLVSIRTGIRPYFIEKEAKTIFLALNSQGSSQNPIFHRKYWKVYMTNVFLHSGENENALRYFFRYMSL